MPADFLESLDRLVQEQNYYEARTLLEHKGDLSPAEQHTLARLYVSTGEFERGMRLFDTLRQQQLFGDGTHIRTQTRWSGESLKDKTLGLITEGGLGDIVCFSRFAPLFKERGARVVIETDEALIPLLETATGVDQVISHNEGQDKRSVAYDFWVPALSAPLLLGVTPEQIRGAPFLRASQDIADQQQRFMVGDFKVGLAWQGNKNFAEDELRSIPADSFKSILDVPGPTFYKLRMWEEHNAIRDPRLIDLTELMTTPSELAAFITNLDLVIAVDTGPAHMASALGIPTWMLNRQFGWIPFMTPPENSPRQTRWYDAMRLYTQATYGNWEEPLQAVKTDLALAYASRA